MFGEGPVLASYRLPSNPRDAKRPLRVSPEWAHDIERRFSDRLNLWILGSALAEWGDGPLDARGARNWSVSRGRALAHATALARMRALLNASPTYSPPMWGNKFSVVPRDWDCLGREVTLQRHTETVLGGQGKWCPLNP